MELQLRGHQISVCLFTENFLKIFKKFFGMFLAQTGSVKRHERQFTNKPEYARSNPVTLIMHSWKKNVLCGGTLVASSTWTFNRPEMIISGKKMFLFLPEVPLAAPIKNSKIVLNRLISDRGFCSYISWLQGIRFVFLCSFQICMVWWGKKILRSS